MTTRPGLSREDAARRLLEVGPNELPPPPRRSLLRRVGAQLADPMILLLMAALVVVLVTGDVSDGIIIVAVIVLNTGIGVTQEIKAETAIAALDQLTAPRATVYRDGRPVQIDAAGVVPDDLVRLEAGDVVPADARLVEAVAFQVDESAMTGESVPVGARRRRGGALGDGGHQRPRDRGGAAHRGRTAGWARSPRSSRPPGTGRPPSSSGCPGCRGTWSP